MTIIQLIQRPQLRGAETFAVQLTAHHRLQGVDVVVLALFDHPSDNKLSDGGKTIEVLGLREQKRAVDFLGYRVLAERIRQINPDIVQANAGDTLKYAALSKRLFGWKGKLVFRNANKMGDFVDSWPKRVYNQQLVNAVDLVASVSENCRLDFLETFSYPAKQTKTLTIGTPVVEVLPLSRRNEVRSDLGINEDAPLLVNVGSFVPEKNHLGLIDIFARVVSELPLATLVLVGDGRLRPEIEAAVAAAGLGDRVTLTGFRQDAVDVVGAADLMLMPSHIEGMPGVILEAMMRGVPVVASAVGGIPEVVKDGQNGRVLPPGDTDGFVRATTELIGDDSRRKAFGVEARKFVLDSKSIARISDEFYQAYRELLGEVSGN